MLDLSVDGLGRGGKGGSNALLFVGGRWVVGWVEE